MMLDEGVDQVLRLRSLRRHGFQSGDAFALAAHIRLLVRIKLRVYEEAVLEIIDSKLSGFLVGDRAEMACDFEVALMGLVDGSLQLGPANIHVRLERGDAAVGPIIDELPGLFRAAQPVHLDEVAVGALEIGSGDVEVRAGQVTGVNFMAQVEVSVGFDAAGSAHGGHAVGEIQSRSRKSHLRHQQGFFAVMLAIEVRPGDIKKMVVHANDSRHDGIALERENRDVLRGRNVRPGLNRENFAAFHHEILVLQRGTPSTVHDAHVGEDHFWRLYADVLLNFL